MFFHDRMKHRMPVEARPGAASGTATRMNALHTPHPSIHATGRYSCHHNRRVDRTRTIDQSSSKNCAVETIGGTINRTTVGLNSNGFSNIRTAMGIG
jgi:hypothetical protein